MMSNDDSLTTECTSSGHVVQCSLPGSAGLQPGLEVTLERGVPREMHKNCCGDTRDTTRPCPLLGAGGQAGIPHHGRGAKVLFIFHSCTASWRPWSDDAWTVSMRRCSSTAVSKLGWLGFPERMAWPNRAYIWPTWYGSPLGMLSDT